MRLSHPMFAHRLGNTMSFRDGDARNLAHGHRPAGQWAILRVRSSCSQVPPASSDAYAKRFELLLVGPVSISSRTASYASWAPMRAIMKPTIAAASGSNRKTEQASADSDAPPPGGGRIGRACQALA